jgi:hypothetical protein
MERFHSVPPLTISQILEIALSNFPGVRSAYALRYAYAGPKSPLPDACYHLAENTSVNCDIYGRLVMTRELVTTDDDEISPLRRNAATMRDAVHSCTEDVIVVEIVEVGIDGASGGIRTRTLADACYSPKWQQGIELAAT